MCLFLVKISDIYYTLLYNLIKNIRLEGQREILGDIFFECQKLLKGIIIRKIMGYK